MIPTRPTTVARTMSTDPKPEILIAEIEEQLHDSGIGTVQVWGGHAVRPGDQVFELKQVTFAGELLRVVLFLAMDGKERVVEVESPRGTKVTATGLRVKEAVRVRVFGKDVERLAQPTGPALHLG